MNEQMKLDYIKELEDSNREMQEVITIYADRILMQSEIMHVLYGDPDKVTNIDFLTVRTYQAFIKIQRYMEQMSLKTVGCQTIKAYVLQSYTIREIESVLLNLKHVGLVNLKLVKTRVVCTLRGTTEFYRAEQKKEKK